MKVTLEEASRRLIAGDVVAVPTETVYGLAACVGNPVAVADIYLLKGRPSNNPLIIHLSSSDQIKGYVNEVPPLFDSLAKRFWPGPLTLVLPIIKDRIPEAVRAKLSTAAFRVPMHPLARQLIAMTGPLVMPSANLSGSPSATCCRHVENDFGEHFPVLDGGECIRGVESTILYWQVETKLWRLARLGAIEADAFKEVLGYVPQEVRVEKDLVAPLCPGQLYRHYAPKARLHLMKRIPNDYKGVLVGFEGRNYPSDCHLISLGGSNDPEVALQRLYAILRRLDQESISEVLIDVDFPDEGLWCTLRERLFKASGGVS